MKSGWNQRLKDKRLEAKLSLQDVGKKTLRRLTEQSLIKYEKGEIVPRADVLENLCFIYKCDINYIIYGEDRPGFFISNEDSLITIWYFLVSGKIKLEGTGIKILDKQLLRNISYLDIYTKKMEVCSMDSLRSLIGAIKRMRED